MAIGIALIGGGKCLVRMHNLWPISDIILRNIRARGTFGKLTLFTKWYNNLADIFLFLACHSRL
jgi:hypothetical protein